MNEKPKFGFVVEYVKDIEAARHFYEEVLGLVVEREHPAFVQFEHFAIAVDEPMSGKPERETYWLVNDAERAFESISGKTEVCIPLKEMPFGKVFGIKNKDGILCYILELSKNRPTREVKQA